MRYKKKNGKKIFFVISLMAVIITTITFAVRAADDNQGYRLISVVEVSGRVGVVKDGIEYNAYKGMVLQEGHEIVTSSNSYARLILDDDKYVKLEAGSKATFEEVSGGKTAIRIELIR